MPLPGEAVVAGRAHVAVGGRRHRVRGLSAAFAGQREPIDRVLPRPVRRLASSQHGQLRRLPAPDQPDAVLLLEAGGDRIRAQIDQAPPPSDLRRQASAELKRRGIDYLLAFDGRFGADDLRDRAGEWGIRLVTEYKGARLYQLP